MREEIRRTDPQTGEQFSPKRLNQKFARPENRIKYNNDTANALRKDREYINKPIHTTHLKLKNLMERKNEAKFSFDYLDGADLKFNTFTHFESFHGILRPAIFEFIIIIDQPNKIITIIKNGRF